MTFMVTAARTANLRAMLVDDWELHGTVGEMMALLESTEQEDACGYRHASLLDPSGLSFIADKKAWPTELSSLTRLNQFQPDKPLPLEKPQWTITS